VNTKRVGNGSEAWCLAKFVSLGWIVLLPFGDNERYDLVIERGNGFETIQVKTGRLSNGCIQFNAYSSVGRVGNGTFRSYVGEVDLFAVYHDGCVYLVPVQEVTTNKPLLRLEATKNNQRQRVRWAKEYQI